MEKLSSSLEDYLETIYNEVQKNGFAKVTDISKILNVILNHNFYRHPIILNSHYFF